MSARELPLPCSHAASKWEHRISSHSDEETDAAGGVSKLTGSFCSVWVCGRDECIEAGKRYVAFYSLRTPVMQGVRASL